MNAPSYCGSIDRFRRSAQENPDRAAVTFATGTGPSGLPEYTNVTFRELDQWSDALAQQFSDNGMGTGTRTIVLVTPGPELYAILFGLFKLGAVPVIIDPGMGLRPMLRCLSAVDPQAFVGLPQAHAVRVLFRRTFRRVKTKVTVGRRWFWGGHTLKNWPRVPDSRPLPDAAAPRDQLLMIAFTTGSTGPAKAVEMSHGNIAAMIEQLETLSARPNPEASLVTLPMFGVLDLFLGSQVILPPLTPSKVGSTDPAHVVDAINRFGVDTMFGSPAVLGPLLEHAREHSASMPSVRTIFSGGAPVPDSVVVGLRDVLSDTANVHAGYGATEAIPMSSIESRELLGAASGEDLTARARSGDGTCIGRPAPLLDARVVAITDEAIPAWSDAVVLDEEIGEIVVTGPNVSTRYYWPASANEMSKIRDGERTWHRTGDLGWIDAQGRIWFCGRKSQRVDTPAGPMFTVQVERIFNAVDGVARTALVGTGPAGAQRPILCVELTADADSNAVIAALRERGRGFAPTDAIDTFLVHPSFPVDIRHNAKIGREKLAVWAAAKSGEANQ